MVEHFVDVLCKDFNPEHRTVIRAFVVTLPIMYTILDLATRDFEYKSLVAQCAYALCLSIVHLTISSTALVAASINIRRFLHFSVVTCVATFCAFALGGRVDYIDGVTSVVCALFAVDGISALVAWLCKFHSKSSKDIVEEERESNHANPEPQREAGQV